MKEIMGLPAPQQNRIKGKESNEQTFLKTLCDRKERVTLYLPKRQLLYLREVSNNQLSRQLARIIEDWIKHYQEQAHYCVDCAHSTAKESNGVVCLKQDKAVDLHDSCQDFKEYEE